MPSIDDLPSDVIFHILKFCTADSIVNCHLVSKKFDQIIRNGVSFLPRKEHHRLIIAKSDPEVLFVISETEFDHDVSKSIAFSEEEKDNKEEEKKKKEVTDDMTYYRRGRWVVHRKTVSTNDPFSRLINVISRRMGRNEYKSLHMDNLSAEEMSTIVSKIEENKQQIRHLLLMHMVLENEDKFNQLISTNTILKAEKLTLQNHGGHCHIPDEIFRKMSFTHFDAKVYMESIVSISFSQFLWIMEESKCNRRDLQLLNVCVLNVEKETFKVAMIELGFNVKYSGDTAVRLRNKEVPSMALQWQWRRENQVYIMLTNQPIN